MGVHSSSKSSSIIGVTVLGDPLRPDHEGAPGGVDQQIAWLFHATRRQIARASLLPVELLTAAACPALHACVAERRPSHQAPHHWAACFAGLPEDDGLAALLRERLAGRFCLGYELPPYLVRLLDQAGIPYLDWRIHPVRFMDDLLVAVRASDPGTQAWACAQAVDESLVVATAGLREATCAYLPHTALADDAILVVGQRPQDSTQIIGGRFFSAAPFLDTVAKICAAHGGIVLKAHPLDPHHSLLVAARGAGLGVVTTRENIYRLLSRPEITAVLTVNSSVAVEAAYFGKRVHTLAPLPMRVLWQGAAPEAKAHASMGDEFLAADFWRTVLAPFAPVSAPDGVALAPKPNRLRTALGSFWNYNEIDTDLLPRPA